MKRLPETQAGRGEPAQSFNVVLAPQSCFHPRPKVPYRQTKRLLLLDGKDGKAYQENTVGLDRLYGKDA